MAQIELQHVSKTFLSRGQTVHALDDVTLSIDQGKIFGIIGMSGAGKSTLVRCINYLEKPTSGDVVIDGQSLQALSPVDLRLKRRKIGMIFQHFNLLMQKNVFDNVLLPLKIEGLSNLEAKNRVHELLETVGLLDKAKSYPAQLSGGQKQRVAIARALATNPEILLCDEATSALDPQTTASILELLDDINKNMGVTIVIITHQMSVVRKICTQVAVMDNGKMVETGDINQIFAYPKAKATKELILRDTNSESNAKELAVLHEGKRIRIVFSGNSAFEPVIANMILKFEVAVNILKADTRNIGGIAKGEMILGLPDDHELQHAMEEYLRSRELAVEEVTDVE